MGYMTTPSGFRKFPGLILCLALSYLNSAFHIGHSYWVKIIVGLKPPSNKQTTTKKYRNSNMKQANLIFPVSHGICVRSSIMRSLLITVDMQQ